VDDLLGQQQVVIKSLDANYGHVEGVSGATILGDGSVALILDLPGLIRIGKLRAAA
jgi:two-component system, chemotaxis family, sensor kinase CheA